MSERERDREKEQERFSQPLLGSVHCPLSSPHPLSSPALALGGGPAQLWSAEDMDRVAAGDCTYVPTQLYPTQCTDSPQSLSLLALRRLRLMSATEHSNTTLGKIYIGNCVEPMQWAGEHVGFVIDASDGRSNVNAIVQKPFPRGWWLYFLSPSSLSHVLRNYAWHRDCIRQWLWVSKGRLHNGGTWW